MTTRRDFLKLGAAPLAAQTASTMRAGTAKVDVTPDRPRIMALTGRPPNPAVAYLPIHARCLSLYDGRRRLVFVTYDFNCLDVATPLLRERVERELGIPPACLLLLATHNHQSPIQITPSNFDYGRWLAEKIFALIKEAIGREDGPVDLHFAFGHGYFIRTGGKAPPDYEIQVLKVSRRGRAAALLFNHPTHPLPGPPGYGPSHPGFAMDEIEQRFPGALALYADACGGNQYCLRPEHITDPLAACKYRGHELAQAVTGIAEGKMQDVTGPIESTLKVVALPLAPPPSYRGALELARGVPLDVGFWAFPDPRRDTNWIRNLIKHYREGIPFPARITDYICTDDEFLVFKLDQARKYPCRFEEVVGARIGPLTLVALQGEPCAPIGARIKEVLRQRGPAMVFGYFAEHNLYIPTREIVRVDGYQAQALQVQYSCPMRWSEEVEDEMVKGALAVVGAEPFPDPRPVPLRKNYN